MRVVGYVRVSTEEQGRSGLGLEAQREAIRRRYPSVEILQEVKSAGRADNREVLKAVLSELGRGDTLVVAKLDRLARSVADFHRITERARRQGWTLVMLDIGLDTGTAIGKAMTTVLAAFAELERDMISIRAREAAAVRNPEAKLDERFHRIRQLHAEGLSQRAIQRELGLPSKETVARALRAVVA